MQPIKQGKVKDVYEINENELLFLFSDRISVFDKVIPSTIPYKGETLARTGAYWFDIAKQLGFPTHYIKLDAPNKMRVRRVNVIRDYNLLTPKSVNYLIPLECITRYYIYGSLWDRVREEKVKPEELGFPHGHEIKLGEELPQPFFEVTTKLEAVDRKLTTEEALRISGVAKQEFARMREIALDVDKEINSRVKQRGLIHVDGKKEFAFDEKRNLMIVDTFGTADEDRFWDAKELEKGRFVERSKEFVRQYYRKTGYHDALLKARETDKEEPPIPPLPEDMIQEVSNLYIQLFEDITGQSFR